AIEAVGFRRRAAIAADPIAAQLVAGSWRMPRPGDAVTFVQGQTRRWEPITAGADGWFSHPSLRGGYLAATIAAPGDAVMMLEASGHARVFINGEPRVGDNYSDGYVRLPVRMRKGPNTWLFHSASDRVQARLTKPRAPVFLSTADITVPDL